MIHVTTAEGDARRAALALLLGEVPPEEREPQIDQLLATDGGIDLTNLLVAIQRGEPVGAALFLLQPDGCGFLWPPRAKAGHSSDAVGDALLSEVARRLDAAGAWLGQCLVDVGETRDRALLERNGFQHLANLHYLHRDLFAPIPTGNAQCEVVQLNPDSAPDRYGSLIERTYHGTRDCPELNGLRSGRDAVEGHKSTGVFLPDEWFIFRRNEADIGVLVIADQPDQHAREIVYMGVTPEARGLGVGREIVLHAMHVARQGGRGSLLLAVDGENKPAQRIYESLGFVLLLEKAVHVRPGKP